MGILMYTDYNNTIRIIKIEKRLAYDMYTGTSYVFDYQDLKRGDILYCYETKHKYIIFNIISTLSEEKLFKLHLYSDKGENFMISRNNIYWEDCIEEYMTFKKIDNINLEKYKID